MNIDVMRMRSEEVIGGAGHDPDLERGRERGMETDTGIPDDAPEATIGGGRNTRGTGERGVIRRRGDGGRGRGSDGDEV